MKIIGHTGGDYLAQLSEDEIAILLGFRGIHGEAYKTWRRAHTRSGMEQLLEAGTTIEVHEIAKFWQAIQWKEDEAKKAAANLRALADLITTNLPSGIVPPAPQEPTL